MASGNTQSVENCEQKARESTYVNLSTISSRSGGGANRTVIDTAYFWANSLTPTVLSLAGIRRQHLRHDGVTTIDTDVDVGLRGDTGRSKKFAHGRRTLEEELTTVSGQDPTLVSREGGASVNEHVRRCCRQQ